ncbi:uncharacterized protein [Ptychodera flava]
MEKQSVNNNDNNRPRKAVVALSITQIVIGITVAVIGTMLKIYDGPMAFVCAPIWNGLLFTITGSVSLLAERGSKSCYMGVANILRMLSITILSPILIACVAVALFYLCVSDGCDDVTSDSAITDFVLNSLVLVLAVVYFVITILTCGSCIKRCCCCCYRQKPNTRVAYLAYETREMGQHLPTAQATDRSVSMVPWYGYQVTMSPGE